MEQEGPEHGGNLVGTLLDGRYRVGPMVARGGMSTVYRGTDLRLDRPVAIKVMDPRFAADPVFLQRFEREARAAARLHHSGIVGVYDQGVDSSPAGDHAFLIMELVDGGTLRDLLREHGRLPVPLALSVLELVLSALATAHREGLVHRDVKPENVLIGPGGTVKVADFGLVRAVAAASSSTGNVILGTVAYLSPEQVEAGAADPRSDVYAAGVLLFEMLTGAPPYTGDTALSVAYRHVNDDVPAPSTVVPALPAVLDELVVRTTRREPSSRPADAAAFLLALQQVCTDLGIDRVAVPLPAAPSARASTRVATTHGAEPRGAATSARTALADPPWEHGPRGTRALTRAVLPPDGSPPGRGGPAQPPPRQPEEDSYQRQRTHDRRVFLIWTVVVLLLASVIGVSAWWLGNGRWTIVPDLTGLQRSAVQAALAGADLDTTLTEDHHDTVPDGAVISSHPGSGSRALRGSEVTVVLSLGRPVVPDLPVGAPAENAEQVITEADLSPRRDPAAQEHHDTVAAGAVIGLRPASGTVLTVGAPVTLVVSKGPAPATVPDVRGAPETEAISALARAGLSARVRRMFDDEVPGGRAIGTDPGAGAETTRGADVVLLVSTALVVPEVVGQPREQALATLAAAGLQARERGDGAGERNAVVRAVQPGAGSLVTPSDNVVTVVMTTRLTVPDVVGMPAGQAREVLAAAGLNSEVRRFLGDSSSPVLAQSPRPGRTVRPGETVRLRTF